MSRYLPLVALALIIAGCGGSSGPAGEGTVPIGGTPVTYGDFSLIGTLNTPPVGGGSDGTRIYGFAGTIATARLHDANPTLAETVIAAGDNNGHIHLFAGDGSSEQIVHRQPNTITSLAINDAGNRIFFSDTSDQIRSITLGSSAVAVTAGSVVAFSPDGTQLAFRRNNNEIWRSGTNGANATRVYTSPNTVRTIQWLSNTHILFGADSTGTNGSLFRLSLSGTATSLGAASLFTMNRDRTEYVFSLLGPPSTLYRGSAINDNFVQSTSLGENAFASNKSTFLASPRTLLMQEFDSTSGTIALRQFDLLSNQMLGTVARVEGNGGSPAALDATGFITDRYFVGAGSPNTAAVAGLLIGQQGSTTESVLVFNATTKSTAQIQKLDGGDEAIYDLWADRVTSLTYGNNPNFVFKSGFVGSAVITGAVVTFDYDGSISTILPYNLARGGARPRVVTEGGRKVIIGDFLARYDAKGENLAPQGTSRVEL